jgi:hypothetical protein
MTLTANQVQFFEEQGYLTPIDVHDDRTASHFRTAFDELDRTSVLAIVATTLYLTLAIVCDWGATAWWAVGLIAVLAAVYTAL